MSDTRTEKHSVALDSLVFPLFIVDWVMDFRRTINDFPRADSGQDSENEKVIFSLAQACIPPSTNV